MSQAYESVYHGEKEIRLRSGEGPQAEDVSEKCMYLMEDDLRASQSLFSNIPPPYSSTFSSSIYFFTYIQLIAIPKW